MRNGPDGHTDGCKRRGAGDRAGRNVARQLGQPMRWQAVTRVKSRQMQTVPTVHSNIGTRGLGPELRTRSGRARWRWIAVSRPSWWSGRKTSIPLVAERVCHTMASTPAAKSPMRVAMTLDIKPGMVRAPPLPCGGGGAHPALFFRLPMRFPGNRGGCALFAGADAWLLLTCGFGCLSSIFPRLLWSVARCVSVSVPPPPRESHPPPTTAGRVQGTPRQLVAGNRVGAAVGGHAQPVPLGVRRAHVLLRRVRGRRPV